jgi:F0F1-type ATP synthase epsilon subunit
MHLEILTPTTKITQMDVFSATLPGLNGQFTALKGHTKFCASLKDELVKVIKKDQSHLVFLIREALAFVEHSKILIIAEYASKLAPQSLNEEDITNLALECSKNLNLQNKDSIFKEYWNIKLQECTMLKNYMHAAKLTQNHDNT